MAAAPPKISSASENEPIERVNLPAAAADDDDDVDDATACADDAEYASARADWLLLVVTAVVPLLLLLAVPGRAFVGCSSSVEYSGEPESMPDSGFVYSLCAAIELERKSRRNAPSVRAYDLGPLLVGGV